MPSMPRGVKAEELQALGATYGHGRQDDGTIRILLVNRCKSKIANKTYQTINDIVNSFWYDKTTVNRATPEICCRKCLLKQAYDFKD